MTIADGVVEPGPGGRRVLRFERRMGHPVDRVWDALTDPARLLGWWGRVDADLTPGGHFHVAWLNTDDDGNAFEMKATVSEIDPPRVLEVASDPETEHGVLRFELEPDGDSTILRFTSTLDLADEFRSRTLAGWHTHLDALTAVLDGHDTDLVNLPGWEENHAAYEAQEG
jgi:uncharacterized protein YndB with AHSA1/START domain